ncbi:MAG TPA: D-serine ammonia-lyase [Flavobacteriaceae bacterium]|nr:D-serine ammonia-lyase [Flavobacteriaceae bacterium]
MYSQDKIQSLIEESPMLQEIIDKKPVLWLNPKRKKMRDMPNAPLKKKDMKEAAELWERFAPLLEKVFPETATTNGRIESALKEIPKMKDLLVTKGDEFEGRFFVKCDNALPVAGSIKARGGFFEILHYAEELALKAELVNPDDDYSQFASQKMKDFFSQYHIGVASTGNLGLSIGIMSATLGFAVKVYMSGDAKEWKKNLLKEKGAEVIEFPGDFGEAISEGRRKTRKDPKAYFVDDENSYELFLGYTVGALRIAEQIEEKNIKVDADHPLFVYSPCGVGGSPGGTAFGLKQIFGDHVHCFYVEPTHSPSVLTGLLTGELSKISVQDIGLDNITEADGLAVGQPSNFATKISSNIVSGIYTVEDEKLFELLADLVDTEDLFLEPSATPGLLGPQIIANSDYPKKHNLNMKNATHIAWATGGDLVPDEERKEFYERGKSKNI